MAALKNPRHEIFCQTYVTSPLRYVRYNATQSYLKAYWNASANTASTNGSRLVARYWDRIIEIYYEEQSRLQCTDPLVDYRRRVEKKFKPDRHQHNKKSDQSQSSSIVPTQIQDTAKEALPEAYKIPKHLIDNEAVNDSECDPWDVVL